jgi:ADP-ribose pyrophosphatase YjhB (NUDIX family)
MAELHGWYFCPRCRAELAPEGAPEPLQARCSVCGSHYYAHSAPTVGALCEDGQGRLMLVRRGVEPRKGKWDTPGGFLEEGERPLDGLRRELLEETGLEIEPGEFVGAATDLYGDGPDAQSILSLNWTARVSRGTPAPADDISEIRWFFAGELPKPEEIGFASVVEILALWCARRR